MLRLTSLFVRSHRVIRNAVVDLKFGGLLGFAYLDRRKTSNTDYNALSHIFRDRIKDSDVLVDIGCGAGRVINWWLLVAPHNRVIGIEMDKNLAERTRRRLKAYENVTIVSGDALENIPKDSTLIYLFNPFGREVMEEFKERIRPLLIRNHAAKVLYYNCKYVDVFQNDPAFSVEIIDVGQESVAPFDRLAEITASV